MNRLMAAATDTAGRPSRAMKLLMPSATGDATGHAAEKIRKARDRTSIRAGNRVFVPAESARESN